MGYIGKTPTPQPLTATDIPDLPATKITSGTFPALNGSNLTNLDASDLTGTLPAISGANLTGIATDYVKLATVTASGSATSVGVDGYFSSTYDKYILYCTNFRSTNDNSYITARYNISNSAASGSNYQYVIDSLYKHQNGSVGNDNSGGWNDSAFRCHSNSVDSNSDYMGQFYLEIFHPLSTGAKTILITHGHGVYDQSLHIGGKGSVQYLGSTSAITGFTFYISTGNMYGTFTLYGIK